MRNWEVLEDLEGGFQGLLSRTVATVGIAYAGARPRTRAGGRSGAMGTVATVRDSRLPR